MAWVFANTKEEYVGETHELLGKTYSGATRTPESRRLDFIEEKPKSEPKPQPSTFAKRGRGK